MFYIGGVDEAGRGPVLGPMCMAIVALLEKDKEFLQHAGVKDSKLLSPKKRVELAKIIKTRCPNVVIKISPHEIDASLRDENSSLNALEAKTTAKLITRLAKHIECREIVIDLPAKNKETYLRIIQNNLPKQLRGMSLTLEHKADLHHVQVAAASILAKVSRDASLQAYEKRLGLHLGSGYPSDPATVEILSEKLKILQQAKLVRMEWKTTKELLASKSQSRLDQY